MKDNRPISRLRDTVIPTDLTNQLVLRIQNLPPSVKADYLKREFLSKYVSHETDPPEVRRIRAINKWLATERENEATNERLLITSEEYNLLPRVTFNRFVSWCRDFIRDIIGDTPPIDSLIGTFSGGASTSRSRMRSSPSSKYVGEAHVTPSALGFFSTIVDEMPGWLGLAEPFSVKMVRGNVLFTVPKKTDIDRVACKEPDLNMFMQKGVGDYFRSQLRRSGINLNDQSINQSLARKGSENGSLVTLDLSSASDSVSEGLVALLLPECWFTLLDALRCRVTIIDGEEHRNHMFSSMGNGFTFELESLLFYTLTKATAYFTGTRGVVSVYGDDIICPANMSHDLIWVLQYFGFSTNVDKSCIEGPYRESCGGHYWNGFDITPFYIREPIERLDQLIDVANKLRKWGESDSVNKLRSLDPNSWRRTEILDLAVEEIWLWLKCHIPSIFWGGGDLSFKYQLVSYDCPAFRLSEKRRSVDTGLGGYFHWLNATWDRTSLYEGVSTSKRTKSFAERLELKKVRTTAVPRLPWIFLHEIAMTSGVAGEDSQNPA